MEKLYRFNDYLVSFLRVSCIYIYIIYIYYIYIYIGKQRALNLDLLCLFQPQVVL